MDRAIETGRHIGKRGTGRPIAEYESGGARILLLPLAISPPSAYRHRVTDQQTNTLHRPTQHLRPHHTDTGYSMTEASGLDESIHSLTHSHSLFLDPFAPQSALMLSLSPS